MIKAARPLVTIGIPTRNRAGTYLPQAISSAVAQTYPNIEIVVSDNNSVDDTGAVVRSFSDSRIKYFRHSKDLAPNENFNFCLEKAVGEYFLLLHDDDLIDPDFADACIRAVDYQTHVGVIRTGTRVIDDQGIVTQEIPNGAVGLPIEEFFRTWFAGKTALYLCSTLYNTVRLRDAGGFASPRLLFQDAFATIRLSARFGRVDVSECKASFRRHPGGRTFRTKVTDWCEESLALLSVMCDLVPAKREAVREEGLRFFARLNYRRAAEAHSPLGRLARDFVVFRRFNYRYAPPRGVLYRMFEGTSLFSAMRHVKRKVRQTFSVSA